MDSVGEAFRPFVSFIATANTLIQQIEDVVENAEYNKKICNVFLDRIDFASIYIRNLERRKEEYYDFFRDENYYKSFVRFTTVLPEIEKFLKDITHLSGYNKFSTAKNFQDVFTNLTREIDTVMNSLNVKKTITFDEQKKIDEDNLKSDFEIMEKFLKSIRGGILDDNKRMNTSLQEVIIIKNQAKSNDKQDFDNNSIKAVQISPTMLQKPMYPKATDCRGKSPKLCKKILKVDDHIEVACKPITIPDETNASTDYNIVQLQLAILGKLHDSNNILRFYGISTIDSGTVMVLEWAEMGGLNDVYNNFKISWPDKVSIALEICRGLTFLHSCKILHHDIRCGNIVMTKKKEPKITNFDYSREVQGATRELKNLTVAIHWLSPEKLIAPEIVLSPENISQPKVQQKKTKFQPYNFKCEIFSFGMLLWELAFERIPYEKWDMTQISKYVLSRKRELVTQDFSEPSLLELQKEYSKIFMGAWEDDPTIRSSLQQIFFSLDTLAKKYGKSNLDTPFPKKTINPDGTIVRSKHSVSVSDEKELPETKQSNQSGSIKQIISLKEGLLAHKNKDRKKAWDCFNAHAELGSSIAKFWKGRYLDEGYCGYVDKEKGIELYKEAADEGDGDAQFRYAFSLIGSKNFDKDVFIKYLTSSADNGNSTAEFNLGDLYYNGKLGFPKDTTKGIKFLRLAAFGKQPKAIELLNKLGINYK